MTPAARHAAQGLALARRYSPVTTTDPYLDDLFSDSPELTRVLTMRILVVEDDPTLAFLLRATLTQEGYTVDVADNGQDALACGLESDYDLIVLDAMIPPPDGFSVVRELRRAGRRAPVLMLTGLDEVADLVVGLDAGADDYMTKPFSLPVLLARVHALIRRTSSERPAGQPDSTR